MSPDAGKEHAQRPAFNIDFNPQTKTAPPSPTRAMTLHDAGELWLNQKIWKRKKPKTVECCLVYLRALIDFFGNVQLSEFHAGSLRAYQTARSKTVGPSSINHELNALAQILRQAKCWGGIADYYSPLKEGEWQKPKTFTFEEQQHIFAAASGDPELELAELAFTITRNTSASGTELRLARIEQLDLEATPPTFQVTADTTKNLIRPRLLPLNPAAERAFRRVLERANRLGAHFPQHFLFPKRLNPCTYDPTQPASKSWLRHQTRHLRERTGIKHIQPHAWRHQLCTEMLEQGVPAETVRGAMGWVSERMIATYSHTRLAAKAAAFDKVEKVSNPGRPEVTDPAPASTISSPGTSIDVASPAIQAEIARQVSLILQRERGEAEIARQVALALQREREERNHLPATQPEPLKGPRVIEFPGAR